MKMDAEHLIARLALLRRKSKDLAAEVEAFEEYIHDRLVPPTRSTQPVTPELPQNDCRCPPNQRAVAATLDHPQRTVCRLCNKEHD